MNFKDIKTGDLVVELLLRKEIKVIFIEKNDKVIIDISNVNSYTNKENHHVEDALILIYKN